MRIMRRAIALMILLSMGFAVLCEAAGIEKSKAVMRVRVVTASNEGKKQPIPEKLEDLTAILKKWGYNQYQLVQDKAYKLPAGAKAEHKVTPKIDRFVVTVREIYAQGVVVEMALVRWDEEDEKYKVAVKSVKKIANGRTEAFRDGRIRINDKDTIIFLTYADRLDDDKGEQGSSADGGPAE